MAAWVLVPCLGALRNEFDRIAPKRDHASDGSVGDTAHQASTSDHNPDETGSVPIHDADSRNEVHAIDVDESGPWPKMHNAAGTLTSGSMERIVQFLLTRCRAGAETRLRYIIFNRRIWEAKNDWVQRTYTGSNPHDKHAHFSASYDTAREADVRTWHLTDLLEEDVPLTDAEIKKIATATAAATATATAEAVWVKHKLKNPYSGVTQGAGELLAWVGSRAGIAQATKDGLAPQFAAVLAAIGADNMPDESVVEIVSGVLAGLTPARLSQAFAAAGLTAEAVAAALPDDIAGEVADRIAARLAD